VTKKAPTALEAAYHEAWDEPVDRCDSRNPDESVVVRHLFSDLYFPERIRWKARCVKSKGHPGPHLGPDESVWQEGEAKTNKETSQ